jgi:hypothetical protein
MAAAAYLESLMGGMPADVRQPLVNVFRYLLRNLRIGHVVDQTASENLQGYFFRATTPSAANTEFSIAHGLGKTPYLVIPVLPLDVVDAQIVPLQTSRAADNVRVYLKSSVTNAVLFLFVEG